MCIACGACRAVDSGIRLQLEPKRLVFEPHIDSGPAAAEVCPSVEVNYEALQRFVFGMDPTGPLGLVDSVQLAQSTNLERNRRASSGGLIKEAIIHLLQSGRVDAVVSIAHHEGLDYRARLVRSPEEVDGLPGSIYHSIDLSSSLDLLLETDLRLGLVAIPCQLEGIYNFLWKKRPDLRKRVVFTIGLLCAWQYSRHSVRAMGSYARFDADDIDEVAYRGGDPIGKFWVRLRSGKEVRVDRRASLNYQVAFDRSFNTPRCNVCINHTNYLADLVVGDSWMQSTRFSKTGVSIALCRTLESTRFVQEMVEMGRLRTRRISEKELIESEGEALVFGNGAYAWADMMRRQGLHTPKLVGPNRPGARLQPRGKVESAALEQREKQRLMAEGHYKRLWARKVTMEGNRIATRYFKWFVNRVLRLKKLTGRDRHIRRQDLQGFR